MPRSSARRLLILLAMKQALPCAASHPPPSPPPTCEVVEVPGSAAGGHVLCTPSTGSQPRDELVLFFPGGGGHTFQPWMYSFIQRQVDLGFYYVGLAYVNAPGLGSKCGSWPTHPPPADPDGCFRNYTLARLFGGECPDGHVISSEDGASGRLAAVLADYAARKPDAGWGQFLKQKEQFLKRKEPKRNTGAKLRGNPGAVEGETSEPAWERIIAAGHSQGSGMALMLSKRVSVSRVAQFSGTDDANWIGETQTPASWTAEPGVTPAARIFGFGNTGGFCCWMWHQTWAAAQLEGWAAVDGARAPFGGAHNLCSSVNVSNPSSGHADPVGNPAHAPVWDYMMTSSLAAPEGPRGRRAQEGRDVTESEVAGPCACTCPPPCYPPGSQPATGLAPS